MIVLRGIFVRIINLYTEYLKKKCLIGRRKVTPQDSNERDQDGKFRLCKALVPASAGTPARKGDQKDEERENDLIVR